MSIVDSLPKAVTSTNSNCAREVRVRTIRFLVYRSPGRGSQEAAVDAPLGVPLGVPLWPADPLRLAEQSALQVAGDLRQTTDQENGEPLA
jgi:hypothetical protein